MKYMIPSRTLDLCVLVQNVCTDEGLTAFEMFDVLKGFNPFSFAKPSFTGGKCLMKGSKLCCRCTCFTSLTCNMTVHLSLSFGLCAE